MKLDEVLSIVFLRIRAQNLLVHMIGKKKKHAIHFSYKMNRHLENPFLFPFSAICMMRSQTAKIISLLGQCLEEFDIYLNKPASNRVMVQ